MIHRTLRSALLAGIAICAVSAAAAQTLNFTDPYIGGALTGANLGVDSGGLNTIGPHTNTNCFAPEGVPALCSSSATVVAGSVFAGFDNLASLGPNASLRVEGEISLYQDSSYVTGSFPGASPFAFFYDTTVTEHRAAFANVYVDHALDDKFTLFGGGGVGMATMTVVTADGVVQALPQSDTNFAWNAGVGISYEVRPGLDLFTQYRYVDFGTADVDLTTIVGGAPAGNYELDMHANEIRLGVRMTF